MESTMSREEHDETLIQYHSYPNYTYYVQSPSTTTTTHINTTATAEVDVDPPHLLLSRYSSSRGSNNSFSFTDVKKTSGATMFNDHDHQFDVRKSVENRLIIVDLNRKDGGGGDNDEEEEYWPRTRGCWWRYFSLRRSNSSSVWIFLQVLWRVLVSFGLALLVFYVVTKPPPPKIDIKIASIRQFVLAEGIDATGVATKVLNCNISISVEVDNKSKLFNLHIRPPLMELSYDRLPFASSHRWIAPDLLKESGNTTSLINRLLHAFYVYINNKPIRPFEGSDKTIYCEADPTIKNLVLIVIITN